MDDGGFDNRALAQRQAFVLQVVVDGFQNPCRELMLLQQVPEIHDRRVFGNRRAERQSSKLAHQKGTDLFLKLLLKNKSVPFCDPT
ncbi:hypothetical protein TZ03_04830 [Pseudomonas sp. 10-1B]|nr:hypothetical protein TZ03_04830 [Pseudomonas sp. 10-1B]